MLSEVRNIRRGISPAALEVDCQGNRREKKESGYRGANGNGDDGADAESGHGPTLDAQRHDARKSEGDEARRNLGEGSWGGRHGGVIGSTPEECGPPDNKMRARVARMRVLTSCGSSSTVMSSDLDMQ